MDVAITLLISSILSYLSWIAYTLLFHPLSRFPGPLWPRISKFWYMYQVWKGDLDETWSCLHRQYGAFVRVAPNEISVTDPTVITRILDAKGTFPKADIYSVFEGGGGKFANLVTIRDETQHAQRRRAVGSLYSIRGVSTREEEIDTITNQLMNQIALFSLTKTRFDVSEWLQRCVKPRRSLLYSH